MFATYVDLTKAFNTVSKEGLWKIMAKYGCPRKLSPWCSNSMMQARVPDNGELAPTLFSLMFTAMLTDAFRDGGVGVGIRYCTLFNFRRLEAKPKVMTDMIRNFLFAEDCALNAVSEADMHCSVDKFLPPAQTSASPSAQRRLKCYISLPQGNRTLSPTSQSMARE